MTTEICAQCVLIAPTTTPQARVKILMQLSQEGAADARVQTVVAGLVAMLAERLARNPTPAELAQWFADSVHLLMDYTPDPPGEEVFQTVVWSLGGECGRDESPITGARKGCGDCEDLASLLVAFCMVVGIRARVVWMEQPGSPLNHVSAQVWLDPNAVDGWLWLDATLPGALLGENPYAALTRLGADFRTRVFGVENTAAFAAAGEPRTNIRPTVRVVPLNVDPLRLLTALPLRLLIANFPSDSKVFLGENQLSSTGSTVVGPHRAFVVPQDTAGQAREVRVIPDGNDPARRARVSFNENGDTHVDFNAMTKDPAARDAVVSTLPLRLVISSMPDQGKVFVGDVRLSVDGSTRINATTVALPVPASAAGGRRDVRVTVEGTPDRVLGVTFGASGDTPLDYLAMTAVAAVTDTLPPRLVISSMPNRGKVFVGDVQLSTADATPINATTLAFVVPTSAAGGRREVRVTVKDAPDRVLGVTIGSSGDTPLDYLAMTPVAAVDPVRPADARLTVTGVPLTSGTPGAIPLENGSIWVVLLTNTSNINDTTTRRLDDPNGYQLTKQADGTTYVGLIAPGTYRLAAFRSVSSPQGVTINDSRVLPNNVRLNAGANVVAFSDLQAPIIVDHNYVPVTGATLRITGVLSGWQASITGALPGTLMSCSATDACTIRVPATGGVVRVSLTKTGNPTVLASRVISVPAEGAEVDVAWDIRRAAQFEAGNDGLVSCDPKGLRCGYLSTVTLHANEQRKFLTDLQARRTVKEFEKLTPTDASGRAIYAVFVRGHGMTAMRATLAEAERLARDVAWLSTGKADANGYLPFELTLNTAASNL